MTIRKDGLAWRWYQEWVHRGGEQPPVMNLCHFVRVLVVWGPLRALFERRKHPHDKGKWQDEALLLWPLVAVLILAILCGVGLIAYKLYMGGMTTVWVAGVILVGVGVLSGLVAGVGWLKKNKVPNWQEAARLYRDYRAAKTSKVCPLVTVD